MNRNQVQNELEKELMDETNKIVSTRSVMAKKYAILLEKFKEKEMEEFSTRPTFEGCTLENYIDEIPLPSAMQTDSSGFFKKAEEVGKKLNDLVNTFNEITRQMKKE